MGGSLFFRSDIDIYAKVFAFVKMEHGGKRMRMKWMAVDGVWGGQSVVMHGC